MKCGNWHSVPTSDARFRAHLDTNSVPIPGKVKSLIPIPIPIPAGITFWFS